MEVTQFEWQTIPLAHSLVLKKLSTSPTLLPEQLASLITAISLAARVSIRASALFVEAIMETARYSTTTSLGLTRRALIAAVGSARTLHFVDSKLDWSGKGEDGIEAKDAFLQVLDKYTNLGIYLIHHTFTLTELFTMSSFYLTLSTIQTGFTAAEASVRLLDSLLGSNETSRALASIITLVKSELSEDYRFTEEERRRVSGLTGGGIGLTALTKALTAWVCLQMVTHRRSLKEMRLKVVYDCTIVKALEGESSGGAYYGSRKAYTSNQNGVVGGGVKGKGKERETDRSIHQEEVQEGEILTDVRSELEATSISSRQNSNLNLFNLVIGGNNQDSMGDEGENQEEENEEMVSSQIVEELELLCSGGNDDSEVEGDSDSELPEEVRLALREIQQGHTTISGVGIVATTTERDEEGDGLEEGVEGEYDIEVEEITTTRTTTIIKRDPHDPNNLINNNTGFNSLSTLNQEDSNVLSNFHQNQSGMESDDISLDEWVEIGALSPRNRRSRSNTLIVGDQSEGEEDVEMLDISDIPMAINGKRRGSLATSTRQDALAHPEENKQRLQIVLRTMTKKFIQRKRSNPNMNSRSSSTRTSRNTSPSRLSASTSFIPSPSSPIKKLLRSPHSTPIFGSSVTEDLNKATVALEDDQVRKNNVGSKSKNVLKAFSKVLKKVPSENGSKKLSGSNFKNHENGYSSTSSLEYDSIIPSPVPTPTPMTRRSVISPLSPLSSTTPTPPLLRKTSSTTSMHTTFTQTRAPPGKVGEEVEPKSTNWPHQHLVENLQLFMRYSSGAYGQAFLRILGIGRHDFNYSRAQLHVDANNHSFAHHVGVDVEDILLSSYTDAGPGFSTAKMSPIVNYVAIDHSIKSIVLSCRGSLGLSDILVDLTCSYEMINVQHGDPQCSYYVHSGMWCSATTLQRGTIHDVIKSALANYPDYGLVLCGHSLGGGVAALLSILWSCPAASFERHASQYSTGSGKPLSYPPVATHFVTSFASGLPPGRPISCYTFGPPCVASPDLARYCEGLVISTIHNYDIVPTLSLGVLRDLKTMAMGLYSEGGTAEEIVGRVIGLYQRKFIANRTKPNIPIPTPTNPTTTSEIPPTESGDKTGTTLSDLPEEAKHVGLTDLEMNAGRGNNKALDPSYKDPSLLGPEVSEDVELNDWLWSLVKTMRAGNDNEKLYPPGQVYIIESYTVFISSETIPEGQDKYSRKEGKRIILRSVEDVEARFSEPVFGRTMMSDHSPVGYESNLDLLYEANFPYSTSKI